ncbi:pentatricopeptide repeat-containing protein At5g42450, mitochondrial [Diospyros lotus]|uniref:pentatricopeptide repeat-containing protein At5g42450, mitochondrial n=1 Tax=Diospyros lotus TaxID=55363 RepID=UPI00224F9D37|nr:pentatricopeptide repeat-containing protein At5g42450, mitochondrial [Diospyros lotus]
MLKNQFWAHVKSRIRGLFPSQPIFKLRRQAHTSAHDHLIQTRIAHGRVLKLGISTVESGIVKSYCESSAFLDARQLFDETPDWDVVSATATISRFARHRCHSGAFYLFSRMAMMNISPNEFTFSTVIHSSTALQDLYSGRQLHGFAAKIGLDSNVFVGSAILDLYAKLSSVEEAQRAFEDIHEPNVVSYSTLIYGYLKKERFDDALNLFQAMPERNVVSWNAMIGGYSQMGHNEEAVNLFIQMLREGLVPNQSTFPCAISAASNIAALGMGRSLHACAVKFLGNLDVFLGNSLASFYAKCGSMEDSLLVFSKLPERNTVSWNALICGFAQNGRGNEALDLFQKMQHAGLQPNSITLLGVLQACNYAGLVDEGYLYFNRARLEDPSFLKPEHYACMVDLLSRAGRLQEAKRFIGDLPFEPGIGFWKALLSGCQIHSNIELGELAARKVLDLDPGDVSSYVMLSNTHSAAERWKSVAMIRQEMKEKGMKRVPGCSWIEIKNHVHVFVTADRRDSKRDEIYLVLRLFLEHVSDDQALNFLTDYYIQLYNEELIQEALV